MLRSLKRPANSTVSGVVGVSEGGLGVTTPEEGLQVLGGVSASRIDQPDGPIGLDENGRLPAEYVQGLFKAQGTVSGPSSVVPGQIASFYLTAYDSFSEYTVESVLGQAVREDNVIHFIAGQQAGIGGLIINGKRTDIVIEGNAILPPSIVSPTTNASDREITLTVTLSDFDSMGTADTHVSTDFQLSKDVSFVQLAKNVVGQTTDKTSIQLSALEYNTVYFARARYTGASNGQSAWGPVSTFKTKIEDIAPLVVTSPSSGTSNLSSSQIFTAQAYVPVNETVSIPQMDAGGNVTGYVNAQRSSQHVSTKWELSTHVNFTTVAKSFDSAAGVYSWMASGLAENTTYYLRARFEVDFIQPIRMNAQGTVITETTRKLGNYSQTAIYQTMAQFSPFAPSFTSPTQNATGLGPTITLTTSAFSSPIADTHVSSDWEIALDSNFNDVIASSYDNASSKLSWTSPSVQANQQYYARARHNGQLGGKGQWSSTRQFTTAVSYVSEVVYSTPGTYTYTIPAGVVSIDVQYLLGGGGGGGGAGPNGTYGGGGASSGNKTVTAYPVSAGDVITINVGWGGARGRSSNEVAVGGFGGGNPSGETGGGGQLSSLSKNSTVFLTSFGAQGGSGGTEYTHGTAAPGADGGNSGSAYNGGSSVLAAGGGGNASGSYGSGGGGGVSSQSGGVGGNGYAKILLNYAQPPAKPTVLSSEIRDVGPDQNQRFTVITGSTFSSPSNASHVSTDIQTIRDYQLQIGYIDITQTRNVPGNNTEIWLEGGIYSATAGYFRIRYIDSYGNASPWSEIVSWPSIPGQQA